MKLHRVRRFHEARIKILKLHGMVETGTISAARTLWQGAGFRVEGIPAVGLARARREAVEGWGADTVVFASAPWELSWLIQQLYWDVFSEFELHSALNHKIGDELSESLLAVENKSSGHMPGSLARGRFECHALLRRARTCLDAMEEVETQ